MIGNYKVNTFENDTFIYIGRLSPEKGVDLLCKAVHMLHCKAIIIGDGSEREKLENEYSLEIEFTGWKKHSEMESYIKKQGLLFFLQNGMKVLLLQYLRCSRTVCHVLFLITVRQVNILMMDQTDLYSRQVTLIRWLKK